MRKWKMTRLIDMRLPYGYPLRWWNEDGYCWCNFQKFEKLLPLGRKEISSIAEKTTPCSSHHPRCSSSSLSSSSSSPSYSHKPSKDTVCLILVAGTTSQQLLATRKQSHNRVVTIGDTPIIMTITSTTRIQPVIVHSSLEYPPKNLSYPRDSFTRVPSSTVQESIKKTHAVANHHPVDQQNVGDRMILDSRVHHLE